MTTEKIIRNYHKKYGSVIKEQGLTPGAVRRFRSIINTYYNKHKRNFPWRNTKDSYHIVVSEVMLQQTQAHRVVDKFTHFITEFPSVEALAAAPLNKVLAAWQGLGYNRRGKMLHQLAQQVMAQHKGVVPGTPEELVSLPGIGKATAASICAFGFNKPVVFIETNIRTVFIHFFFPGQEKVSDDDILPFAEKTLDKNKPYHWYSALMDYGTMLKKEYPNPGRKSAHHQKQSKFEGSHRQVRGKILKILLEEEPGLTIKNIALRINKPEESVVSAIEELVREGMIRKEGRRFRV
ncbi:MAG: A/G-specific adenine glycosylase [bacterium]|nr:A/G-specific adenine glycosylase [bacterium]